MYVITAHQRYRQTDGRTSSDPMTATLLKHVAVKTKYNRNEKEPVTHKTVTETKLIFETEISLVRKPTIIT